MEQNEEDLKNERHRYFEMHGLVMLIAHKAGEIGFISQMTIDSFLRYWEEINNDTDDAKQISIDGE
jgi:hypothetical protein